MEIVNGNLYIGTSNIVVPGNKSTFPEEFRDASRLHYYSSMFNTVEVNSTFYKIPKAATFQKWVNNVPEHFRFTIKLWKAITHAPELKFRETDISLFLKNASFLGHKKGCLLLQFPSKICFDYFTQVENILETISQSDYANGWKIAVEFRNSAWYTSETFDLLREHQAVIVLHDFAKGKNIDPGKNPPIIYLRFHGPAGDYRGSYSDSFLAQHSREIKEWLKNGIDVFVYFNNTAGEAFANSIKLKTLINLL